MRTDSLPSAHSFSVTPRQGEDAKHYPVFAEAEALSRREQEVHRWIAEGKRNAEIASILGISVYTVHKHVQHILEKLGVENRTAAARVYFTELVES